MATESEETFDLSSELEDEDLWVRGGTYVHYKRLLRETEAHISTREHSAACARYEYEITQRVRRKVTDPEEDKDWEIKETAAHDALAMMEHELEEEAHSAAYYRAMVAEIEADLGDKAQEYEALLAEFEWEFEDWEEEDFDEFDEDEEFDLFAPIPFMDEEDDFEDEGDDEDDQTFEEASL